MPSLQIVNISDMKNWLCPAAGMPSRYLRPQFESGRFQRFHSIHKMGETPQNPIWHPEGTVLNHTLNVCDELWARRSLIPPEQQFPAALAAFLHDNGKSTVTRLIQGRWRATGHELAGEPGARAFLQAIGLNGQDSEFVLAFVTQHMEPMKLYRQLEKGIIKLKDYDKKVSDLIPKIKPEWLNTFIVLCEADLYGRGESAKKIPIKPALELFRATALKHIQTNDYWLADIAPAISGLKLPEALAAHLGSPSVLKALSLDQLKVAIGICDVMRSGTKDQTLKFKRHPHLHRDHQGNMHMHGNCSYEGIRPVDYLNSATDILLCAASKCHSINLHVPDEVQYNGGDLLSGFKFMQFAEAIAAKAAVLLVWENSPRINREDNFRLSRQVDYLPPGFKRCLDVGHAMLGIKDIEEVPEMILSEIASLGDLLALIHLHVNDGKYDQHWTGPGTITQVLGSRSYRQILKRGVPVIHEERGSSQIGDFVGMI